MSVTPAQLDQCEGTLRQALGEVCVLQQQIGVGAIELETGREYEGELVIVILQALAALGVHVSGVPGPARVAAVLAHSQVRVVVSLGGRIPLPKDDEQDGG